jgi:hypothetical protein
MQTLTAVCPVSANFSAALAVCYQADVIGNNTLAHKVVNRVIINHDSLVTSKQLVSTILVPLILCVLACAAACLVWRLDNT